MRSRKKEPRKTLSNLLSDSGTKSTGLRYENHGAVCGFCLNPLESTLNGSEVRHAGSLIPYRQCPQAKRLRK